jgi:hypothetical protein
MADAANFIESIRQRLLAMAADPPYRFRDTRREDAALFQRARQTFEGYAAAEIDAAEARLAVQFPAVFRAYLLAMGKARGDLFKRSSVASLEELPKFRDRGGRFLAKYSAGPLPDKTVVLLTHQGYSLLYLLAEGGFDGPVFQYVETEPAPEQLARGFAELLDTEVRKMEESHRLAHEQGGYWIKLGPGARGGSWDFPALNSCERPLDHPDNFLD